MPIQNTDSGSQKRDSNIEAWERKHCNWTILLYAIKDFECILDKMETALDIVYVLDFLSKAPGENAVFPTFGAQNIPLPKNLILTTSLVCFQCVCRRNVCICMTEVYQDHLCLVSCNIILTHSCAVWWKLKFLQTTLPH